MYSTRIYSVAADDDDDDYVDNNKGNSRRSHRAYNHKETTFNKIFILFLNIFFLSFSFSANVSQFFYVIQQNSVIYYICFNSIS